MSHPDEVPLAGSVLVSRPGCEERTGYGMNHPDDLKEYRSLDGCPTPAADALLRQLIRLAHASQHGEFATIGGHDAKKMMLADLREVGPKELAYHVMGSHAPCYCGTFAIPYQNKDGIPTGGFGYSLCFCMIWWDGTGILFQREWKYSDYSLIGKPHKCRGPMYRAGVTRNEMVCRTFAFGCKHAYEERNDKAAEMGIRLFSHDHLHICVKCGHHYVVDSSD